MKHKKIHFKLVTDDDGYPPVSVESLWAFEVGDLFQIDSIPFFTSAVTYGDIVSVKIDADGSMWLNKIQTYSGNSLIRVVFFEKSAVELVRSEVNKLGCNSEMMDEFNLLAINAPSRFQAERLTSFLISLSERGTVDFEEAILRPS